MRFRPQQPVRLVALTAFITFQTLVVGRTGHGQQTGSQAATPLGASQTQGLVQLVQEPNLSFATERKNSSAPWRLTSARRPSAIAPIPSFQDETAAQDDASPSDQAEDAEAESLAPLQSRVMTPGVHAVNISMEGLGTGVLPEPAHDVTEDPVLLPDGLSRGAVFTCVHWRPSAVCHFPLYFEDAMLERHGHVRFGRLQPVVSGVKFLTTIPLLPYLGTLQPVCEPRYALGHYRPGSCAPALRDHIPWDKNAAAVETVSLATFFWAAPL